MVITMIILFSPTVSPWLLSSEGESWYLGFARGPPQHGMSPLNENRMKPRKAGEGGWCMWLRITISRNSKFESLDSENKPFLQGVPSRIG